MPGSNNENIKFDLLNEQIEILLKNNKNVEKGHTRSVGVTRSLEQPTLLLSKAGKVKETVTFVDVKEVRSAESSNLIQLVCSNSEPVLLRVKSRSSLERWLAFLKECLPDENIYVNPHRPRATTMDQDLRGQHHRTWRRNVNPQSAYYPDSTVLPQPTPAQNLLQSLSEDGYEMPKPFRSLRSSPPVSWSTNQLAAEDEHHTGTQDICQINVNIQVGPTTTVPKSKKPIPGQRMTSSRSAQTGGQMSMQLPAVATSGSNDLLRELKEVVSRSHQVPSSEPPKMSSYLTDSGLGADTEEKEEEAIYQNLPICSNSGNSAAVRGRIPPRTPPKPAVQSTQRNSGIHGRHLPGVDSSSDEDDNSLYVNVQPKLYLTNLRQDLKGEMNEESVCLKVEKSSLRHLEITDTSSGPCISRVPVDLERLFYHGDQILEINNQTIINAEFARTIIETSKNNKNVKVTVKRLVRGHLVEFHRASEGEPLGFSLTNGPEIGSIKPGTKFAREANCAMVERMAITHINGEHIPPGSEKHHVNMRIRKAGLSFSIVIQPIEFLKELMETR